MSAGVTERFRPLLEPSTIAVLGASTRGGTVANIFIRRIRAFGFEGAIYPIHPAAAEMDGLPAYRSLAETPAVVDYAFIAVPGGQIPALLREARGRVRFAQVISSGFGEADDGKALQDELVAAAREGGMRLVGPNCLGLYSHRGRVTFTETWPEKLGTVGVISQSGGLGTDIVRRGIARGLAYSAVITVGNCADLGPADFLDYYLADEQTCVIGMYVESAGDGRRLFELLKGAAARKPVVILKGGRTALGRMAAASHTGSLAGDDRAWVALSRQTGCVLVATLDEFLDALLAFQALTPRSGEPTHRVALFGNGGGASVLATDGFARAGLEVGPFARSALEALAALKLPPGSSITNPVDTPVSTLRHENGAVAENILDAIYRIARPHALVMHLNLSAFVGRTQTDVLGNLMEIALRVQGRYPGQAHFVLVLRADGDPQLEARRREFRARATALGIPVYDELENAARALGALQAFERFRASRNR